MRLTSRQKIGKNNSKNSLRNSKSKKRIIELERLDTKSSAIFETLSEVVENNDDVTSNLLEILALDSKCGIH